MVSNSENITVDEVAKNEKGKQIQLPTTLRLQSGSESSFEIGSWK